MSVLKTNQKTPTETIHYYTAVQLQREITLLLLRDFGVKDKVRSSKFYIDKCHMDPDDAESFDYLLTKYNLQSNKILEEYPEWFISRLRTDMLNTLSKLVYYITQADNMQTVSSYTMCEQRQLYQTQAIGCCKNILQILQYAMAILPIDIEKLMPYTEKVLKEINYIKHWRKKSNKDFKKFNH